MRGDGAAFARLEFYSIRGDGDASVCLSLLFDHYEAVFLRAEAVVLGGVEDVGADIFQRGVCLPSDNKMTAEEQEIIIEVIHRCFE